MSVWRHFDTNANVRSNADTDTHFLCFADCNTYAESYRISPAIDLG